MDFNSAKRLAAFVVGVAVLALNRKLGLDLDTAAQATLATFIMGYIGQSAWKEVKVGGVDSAEALKTDSAAASTIAKIP